MLDFIHVEHQRHIIQAASSDRDRSGNSARAMLEAAESLAGAGASIRYGGGQAGTFGLEREQQVALLTRLPHFTRSKAELLAEGGEHVVYFSEDRSAVIKFALPDIFGYVVDEEKMLDDRTFMKVPKLKHRQSLPSEYFVRWAIRSGVRIADRVLRDH